MTSSFLVLGDAFPSAPSSYRGTDRDAPLFVEGISDRSREVLLERINDDDNAGRIRAYSTARRLAETYRGPNGEVYRVVELTEGTDPPLVLHRLLGFEVVCRGSYHSLVESVLLWSRPDNWPIPDEAEVPNELDTAVRELRERFVPGLNEVALFPTAEAAGEFRRAALVFGTWEGPDFEWEVVGVWE